VKRELIKVRRYGLSMFCGFEGGGSNTSYFEAFLHSCCLNSPIHEDFPKIKDFPKEKRI